MSCFVSSEVNVYLAQRLRLFNLRMSNIAKNQERKDLTVISVNCGIKFVKCRFL
jgi:hypothetical protein